jgi:hypothetical protein
MVYPARDERVVRILKKNVRGLSHFHEIESAIAEERVWVDVLKYRIPEELSATVTFQQVERDVFEYWHEKCEDGEYCSLWLLRFFERRMFVASVSRPGR